MPNNQELATKAKALVCIAFRDGPIEQIHDGHTTCPTCSGDDRYSHISQAQIRDIMRSAVNRLYDLLLLERDHPDTFQVLMHIGRINTTDWDDPVPDPKYAKAPALIQEILQEMHDREVPVPNYGRPQHSQLVWLLPNAGFGPGNTYAVLLPEPHYQFNPDWTHPQIMRQEERTPPTTSIEDYTPCMLDCGDDDCREWTNVFTLPGDSRAEAIANLVAANYSGAAYHVSDCETAFDRR